MTECSTVMKNHKRDPWSNHVKGNLYIINLDLLLHYPPFNPHLSILVEKLCWQLILLRVVSP